VPALFSAVGKSVEGIAQYLPTKAGGSFITSTHAAGTLSPWTGLIVLCVWVAANVRACGISPAQTGRLAMTDTQTSDATR
jgi:hypothetical protein